MDAERKESLLKDLCYPAKQKNGFRVYKLKTETAKRDEENKILVLHVGQHNDEVTMDRCAMLFGETGTGKTHFISTLVNHLYGIEFEHDFRLDLEDQVDGEPRDSTQSQTDYITVYKIFYQEGMKYQSNFFLIDTPGLGDTRGVFCQQRFFDKVNAFFREDYGINELHCIGFIFKANITRAVKHEIRIKDNITDLLGDDCDKITQLLCTFASDAKVPTIDVVKKAGLITASEHSFDNEPISLPNMDDENALVWKSRYDQMNKSYTQYIEDLLNSSPVNIERTRLLHKNKNELELVTVELRKAVSCWMESSKKLPDLEKEKEQFVNRIQSINLTKMEKKLVTIKKPLDPGKHAHNCRICNRTCKICEGNEVYNTMSKTLDRVSTTTAASAIFWGPFAIEALIVAGGCAIASGTLSVLNNVVNCNDKNCCNHSRDDHSKDAAEMKEEPRIVEVEDEVNVRRCKEIRSKIEKLEEEILSTKGTIENLKIDSRERVSRFVELEGNISELSSPKEFIRKIDGEIEIDYKIKRWLTQEYSAQKVKFNTEILS